MKSNTICNLVRTVISRNIASNGIKSVATIVGMNRILATVCGKAASNRNDAVTDNLNRASSLGGTTVTSDILGNRLTKGSISSAWDILNRMTSFTSSGTTTYVYRADSMRVSKSNSNGSTSYRYDGQMGIEDVDYTSTGSVSKVTDYGIGPRGVDAMFVTQSGATSVSYPLHGNG